jgi:hypothetical protein
VSQSAHAETQAAVDPGAAKPQRESPLRGGAWIVGFVASPLAGNEVGTALGFGLGAYLGLQHIPLTLGFDFMSAFWGSDTSHTQVRAGAALVPVDRTREDRGYFLDTYLRLQPIDWLIKPYLEGFVGTKLLATKYSLAFPNTGTSTDATSVGDWAGSIGWGAGLDLGNLGPASFTLGFRRLTGGEASYSRAIDADGEVLVRYTTSTSCMIYMLGVSGSFGVASSDSSATP